MPNYVHNVLTVIGSKKDIDTFYNENKENDEHELSFNINVPEPEKCNWYNWRCENWGCKWDASNISYDDGQYIFTTPWSPPISWLKTVSIKYSKLTFNIQYEDEGFDFFGTSIVKNGSEKEVEIYNYDDVLTYIIVNSNCSRDELLDIAKKYNYKGYGDCDNYDDFSNALDDYIQMKDFKYSFSSSLFEQIVDNLLDEETTEEENTEKED
jgi:hypothetical protein